MGGEPRNDVGERGAGTFAYCIIILTPALSASTTTSTARRFSSAGWGNHTFMRIFILLILLAATAASAATTADALCAKSKSSNTCRGQCTWYHPEIKGSNGATADFVYGCRVNTFCAFDQGFPYQQRRQCNLYSQCIWNGVACVPRPNTSRPTPEPTPKPTATDSPTTDSPADSYTNAPLPLWLEEYEYEEYEE